MWKEYLKFSVELIICLIIFGLLIFLIQTKGIKTALLVCLVCLIVFGFIDCFLIRGSWFKINENLDNVESDNNLSENDKFLQKIQKGYITNYKDKGGLKIKNLEVSNNIEGPALKEIINLLYPVDSIIISDKNPGETLGIGKWKLLINEDENLRFVKLANPNNSTIKDNNLIGGDSGVKLSQDQIPFHDHNIFDYQTVQGFTYHKVFCDTDGATHKFVVRSLIENGDEKTGVADEEVPHNNIPPFIAANFWVRIE